jgi:hypothetical protein
MLHNQKKMIQSTKQEKRDVHVYMVIHVWINTFVMIGTIDSKLQKKMVIRDDLKL